MDIICISDTHNKHSNLIVPMGDVLIHAGDFTEAGTKRETKRFFKWFANQPHQHKICIAGNHDFYMQGITQQELSNIIPKNVHYLEESEVIINDMKFWGSPYTPLNKQWAFAEPNEINKHWDKIPLDTDVLITHIPPHDILDESGHEKALGCKFLRNKVEDLQPRYHVFGHMHDNYGIVKLSKTTFINATSFNNAYKLVNPPLKIKLP